MASPSPRNSPKPPPEDVESDPTTPTGVNRNDEIADEDDNAEIPLTMAASVVLTTLPTDAKSALEGAGDLSVEKVTVSFRPISSAPPLKQSKFKISASQPFSTVVRSLRKKLRLKESESLFCYIGSCFSPSLDEGVGNLWRCFRTGEELVVGYAVAQAFG